MSEESSKQILVEVQKIWQFVNKAQETNEETFRSREQKILDELQKMWQFITKAQKENQKHFISLETRFDGVEARLDGVETRLDRVETRLDGVEIRLGGVETRLDGVETHLGGLDGQMDCLAAKILETDDNIEVLREETKEGFRQVLAQMEGIASKVNKHEQELTLMPEWIKRVESKIDKHLLTPHPQEG